MYPRLDAGTRKRDFLFMSLSFLELICVGFHRYVSIDLGYSLDAKSRVCPVFFLPVILGLAWSGLWEFLDSLSPLLNVNLIFPTFFEYLMR